MLFFTGTTRSADKILSVQKDNTAQKIESLKKMRDLAGKMRDLLVDSELGKIGDLLHENWLHKKSLAHGISGTEIDDMYAKAMSAGALGGKICGAGGGGFLLVYVRKENQDAVRQALSEYQEMHFSFEPGGSRIIYNG
jgi:D-glycero-alpha-D-manno-heptose-7-phosphate kinase